MNTFSLRERKELTNGRQEYKREHQELTNGRQELTNGRQEYKRERQELTNGRQEYKRERQELTNGRQEYERQNLHGDIPLNSYRAYGWEYDQEEFLTDLEESFKRSVSNVRTSGDANDNEAFLRSAVNAAIKKQFKLDFPREKVFFNGIEIANVEQFTHTLKKKTDDGMAKSIVMLCTQASLWLSCNHAHQVYSSAQDGICVTHCEETSYQEHHFDFFDRPVFQNDDKQSDMEKLQGWCIISGNGQDDWEFEVERETGVDVHIVKKMMVRSTTEEPFQPFYINMGVRLTVKPASSRSFLSPPPKITIYLERI